jgi:CRP/FNR family transcriptional regulator, cyclic AMP receptor protein
MTVRGVFVSASEFRDLGPGDVVFSQGDEGHQMFGVVSGAIELRDGGTPLASIGPDGTFGELAIIDHTPRSLTAVATEESRVAVIDERTFLFLVHETPTFALQVMRALAARIRQLDETRHP